MKKHYVASLLGVISAALMIGCGSRTPFQRGKKIHAKEQGVIEKPVMEGTETSTPIPEPTPTETPLPTLKPSPTVTPTPTPGVSLNRTYFTKEILPMLAARKINGDTKGCTFCHGNPAETFEDAEKLVVLGHAEASILFQKATGAVGSKHSLIWNPDSPEALKLILWISGRAIF